MGFEIIQLLLSVFIISLFLGIGWNVVRGFIDGYRDRWEEENILSVNDPLPGEEDEYVDDEEEE